MSLTTVRGASIKFESMGEGNLIGEAITAKESVTMGGGLFKMKKGLLTEGTYPFEEIGYILKGSMKITCEGVSYTVEAGDFLHYRKGTTLRFEVQDDVEGIIVTSPHWKEVG